MKLNVMVMDSKALLDYALFQLTPTRTRCDLVIFCGNKHEKVASGLLEPFLSHLKSAKDEISKGGYSITLKPPPPSHNSPWFTKATLERFVRFVSTPEVLERFVTIEKEIDQIERSSEQGNGVTFDAQGNASKANGYKKFPAGQSKLKYESNGEAEENPKIRLQRVLESRKAMLKKEQAMAYARALVAGFELDDIHDLVSFSDAFGALRLREACVNYIELCNKKNGDKIWMDEVAAMQASYFGTPGIILNELPQTRLDKSSTSDSITRHGSLDTSEGTENALPMEFNAQQAEGAAAAQMPSWPPYHLPHYMHNAQGPVFQQMPLYPGYIFPGGMPSHYPWPANFQDSGVYNDRDMDNSRRYKSSTKKRGKAVQPHSVSNSESIDSYASGSPSDSSSEQEHGPSLSSREHTHNKKLSRRSSKKVVIRNINYIASARNEDHSCASDSDSSGEDESEAAVGALKIPQQLTSNINKEQDRSKKGNSKLKIDRDDETNHTDERKDGNWDIFQNLLMRDSDSTSMEDTGSKTIPPQEEYSVQKGIGEEKQSLRKFDRPKYGSDGLILTERSTGNGTEKTGILFEGEENFHGVVGRSSSKDEALLIPQRVEGEYYLQNAHFGTESSIIKSQKEEDWIIGSKVEISVSSDGVTNHNIFHGDQSSRNNFQSGENKRDVLLDDSFMVQSRLSDGLSQDHPRADIFVVSDIVEANECTSIAPGNMRGNAEGSNYKEPEDLYMMLGHDSAPPEPRVATWNPEMDYGKDISLVETAGILCSTEHKDNTGAGADTVLRGGNKSNIRNGKKLGAEVDRRALKLKAPTGNLGRSKSDIPSRSKTSTTGSTAARGRAEKEEDKRKKTEELLLQRQKRIAERSAAKVITPETAKRSLNENKKSSVSAKAEQTELQSPAKDNKSSRKPVMKSSTIDRLSAPRTPSKQLPTESKVGPNRKTTAKGSSPTATPLIKTTKGSKEKRDKADPSHKNIGTANHSKDASSSIQEKAISLATEEPWGAEGALDKNGADDFGAVKVLHAVTSDEKREPSVISLEDASDDKKSVGEELLVPQVSSEQAVLHINNADDCVGVGNNLKSMDTNINEKRRISFSPQISVMDISTTPPLDSEEQIHSRKKWNNGEGSPKIPRGFRRLLFFGRRS